MIEIDAVLEFEQITNKFYTILKQFAPFGPMNMRPVFQSDNVVLAAPVRIVGENHLKVVLKSKDGKSKMEAIGFKMAHYADKIIDRTFRIAYVIDENEWRGKKSIQLLLKDIKV